MEEIANEPSCWNEILLTSNKNKYPHKTNVYDSLKRQKQCGARENGKTYFNKVKI